MRSIRARYPVSTLQRRAAALPACLLALSALQEPPGGEPLTAETSPFPPARPEEVAIDPAALGRLDALAAGFVEREEIVGCELLVVSHRRTVLHTAHGLADVESGRAMEPDTLFCIRSMTKPLVGVAVQMLIAEGKLRPTQGLGELWPAFDAEKTRAITVEHLLNHTSGFPLSLLLGKDLSSIEGIEDVALLGVAYGTDFPPGERFQYSDQNADTLAALVQRLSGQPLEDYLRTRILEPLRMQDTVCVMRTGEPLRARTASSYAGVRGSWKRFWSPEDEPLFPFLLGSQGVYSTPLDYARFLDMMMRGGRGPEGRLLSRRSVGDLLEPALRTEGVAAGFDTLETCYGRQWVVWTRAGEDGARESVGFGHSGSDGTWAWAFPEQELMVLYFTQSRGNVTGLEIERELERSFLGAPFDPSALAPPLAPLLGSYREPSDLRCLSVVERDGQPCFEVPGVAMLEMRYAGDGNWRFKVDPVTTLRFEQEGEAPATALVIVGGGEEIRMPRLEVDPQLPGTDEVLARVRAAHHLDALDAPVRLSGPFDFHKVERHGRSTTWLAPDGRVRVDVDVQGTNECTVVAGDQAWTRSGDAKAERLEGRRLEQAILTSIPARFGDWTSTGANVRVMFRTKLDDEPVLVLRMEPSASPAMVRFVSESTGRLLREDSIVLSGGMGEVGVSATFSEWSEVGGALLPLRTDLRFPGPVLGTATSLFEEVEAPAELPEGTFELGSAEDEG